MRIVYLLMAVIASMMLILTGCGGGGGGSTQSGVGAFVDSAVEGLRYECSSGAAGITDTNGEFSCPTNDTVSFYLGSYFLGSSTFKGTISPYDLYPYDEEAAINVAQLLQTVDEDDDPDNGITIPSDFSALDDVPTAPDDGDFDTDIGSELGGLVSAEDAENHLKETVSAFSFKGGMAESSAYSDNVSIIAFGDFDFWDTTSALNVEKTDGPNQESPAGPVSFNADNVATVNWESNGSTTVRIAKSPNNQYLIFHWESNDGDEGFGFAIQNEFTGADETLADGAYRVLELMDDKTNPGSYLSTSIGTATFNGNGTGTYDTESFNYHISDAGVFTNDDDPYDIGQFSEDGSVMALFTYDDADNYVQMTLVIKESTGKPSNVLVGKTFNFVTLSGDDEQVINSEVEHGNVTFDGAGSCSIADADGEGPSACSYSVAPDGSLEVTVSNPPEDLDTYVLVGMVSQDNELISVVSTDDPEEEGPFMLIGTVQP